jgi:hypothetical protein
MVCASEPLRVMTSAALQVNTAKVTLGVIGASPSASIACAVVVALPVPA